MNNVTRLHAVNPLRAQAVLDFCADQARFFIQRATDPEGPAAALSIAVEGDGRSVIKMTALEVEHAAVLLVNLGEVRATLLKMVASEAPELLEGQNQVHPGQSEASNVFPLRVRARNVGRMSVE